MTTAVDTNVIVALWDRNSRISAAAQVALDSAAGIGPVVIGGPVFAELVAAPSRDESFVDFFVRDTGLIVEWTLSERIWRSAGRAYQQYSMRRKVQRDSGPRRILADFLIGAHAVERGYRLLTLDSRLYKASFPNLGLISI
jgi:predicted nucleic acid-binding protein